MISIRGTNEKINENISNEIVINKKLRTPK